VSAEGLDGTSPIEEWEATAAEKRGNPRKSRRKAAQCRGEGYYRSFGYEPVVKLKKLSSPRKKSP